MNFKNLKVAFLAEASISLSEGWAVILWYGAKCGISNRIHCYKNSNHG